MSLLGFAAPVVSIANFSLAHCSMLEIGFPDELGTNVKLSGIKYDSLNLSYFDMVFEFNQSKNSNIKIVLLDFGFSLNVSDFSLDL